MDDDDTTELAARIFRAGEIPFHLTLAASERHVLCVQPAVIGGNNLGACLVGGEQRRDGSGSAG